MVAAVSAFILVSVPSQASATDIGGVLVANDFDVQCDSVEWSFLMGLPVQHLTEGWAATIGRTDTFYFPTLVNVPNGVTIYYALNGRQMPSHFITPLRFEEWYYLPAGFRPRAPAVMFSTEMGCAEQSWPIEVARLCATPNPSAGATCIELGPSRAGVATVRVVSACGSTVRVADMVPDESGFFRFRWDARDARGHDVPSGVYFCSVVHGDNVGIARLVLSRK